MTLPPIYVLVLFVSAPDPNLAELTDICMGLAREMAKRAIATPSNPEAVQLTLAVERMARSVRLTRMLEVRLQQDRATRRREDHHRRLDHRKAQLKSALDLTIENQAGLAQGVRLRRELAERLEHDRLTGVLATGSIEQHIARFQKLLGLYLPREAAGGGEERALAAREGDAIDNDLSIAVTNARAQSAGWPAERSEEPGVEGASPTHSASNGDAAFSNHEPHEPHEQALTPSAACDSS